jgi:ubiquinone/menaquinone biosynthesis C-methylase UbiE
MIGALAEFWEARAARFAGQGDGLRAVCSYAMPGFYNRAIDLTQRWALRGQLRSIASGSQVLEYGCGVGRWTREIARRGGAVVGVDFSATMLSQAEKRTAAAGLESRCQFLRSDVSSLNLGRRFDVILGVTVLQHVLDDARFSEAIGCLARHLKPGGRFVLLEVAPTRADARADTVTFRARPLSDYVRQLTAAGLNVEEIRGVDPTPFKVWLIPRFARWPRPLALAALALAVFGSLPLDLALGRRLTDRSWHKVIVARAPEKPA